MDLEYRRYGKGKSNFFPCSVELKRRLREKQAAQKKPVKETRY